MKTIQVSTVVYEMLQELSKKARQQPKAYYEQVVRDLYSSTFK
jgi:predicted CopG family antitoxin